MKQFQVGDLVRVSASPHHFLDDGTQARVVADMGDRYNNGEQVWDVQPVEGGAAQYVIDNELTFISH